MHGPAPALTEISTAVTCLDAACNLSLTLQGFKNAFSIPSHAKQSLSPQGFEGILVKSDTGMLA